MTTTDLGKFDGRDIITTGIKITNAGDGLSQALSVDPQLLHHGEIVHVVLACEVTDVAFKPIKDTDRLSRVHTLRAGIATIVDPELVSDVLAKQKRRIDEAKGIHLLPGMNPDDTIDPESDIPDPMGVDD